jgi:hypothetical protein
MFQQQSAIIRELLGPIWVTLNTDWIGGLSYNVWLCGLCAGVSWFRLLCFSAECMYALSWEGLVYYMKNKHSRKAFLLSLASNISLLFATVWFGHHKGRMYSINLVMFTNERCSVNNLSQWSMCIMNSRNLHTIQWLMDSKQVLTWQDTFLTLSFHNITFVSYLLIFS